ncbi:beta-glucosidase-like glycosyl hydrolase [Streptomyces albogriseolus]
MNTDVAAENPSAPSLWNDPTAPVAARVDALIAAMTLQEKTAQLSGVWVGASDEGGEVAPHQHDMEEAVDLDALLPTGLGQLTRPFGTVPVDPALGALSLARTQARIAASNRFRIPALAHDECLAGFAAWGATAYPVPLSWGAAFDPGLVRRMAAAIGRDMRAVGVHQGLAPVLDVVRDARWGRVEETIGEDPYLVGTIGTAYVQGLESAGIVATLKHFAGYSASRAGRNLAPASMGPRERADVVLPPFEMAIREGGARSVMNAYTDTDGVPSAADETLLTGLLRDTWGFDGTVVADYFAVAFLKILHGVAADWADAAGTALHAGIDVELPNVKTYGAPLTEAVADGRVPEELVDRALRRVLTQKAALGLLDPDWNPVPAALDGTDPDDPEALRGHVDLDSPENRALARALAEEAVVLLSNDGTLPLGRPRRIALIGPNADEPTAVLGCYSLPPAHRCPPPRHTARHRPAHPARDARRGVPRRRHHPRPRHRRRRRRPLRPGRGGTGGTRGRRHRRGAGRPRRPVRTRHERRGMRRRDTGPARRAAAAPRRAARHRDARGDRAAGGTPVRARARGDRVGCDRAVLLPR